MTDKNTTVQFSARLREIQQTEIARHLGREPADVAVQTVAEQFMKRVSAWLSCQLYANNVPEQHRNALALIFELDKIQYKQAGNAE